MFSWQKVTAFIPYLAPLPVVVVVLVMLSNPNLSLLLRALSVNL